MAGSRYRGVQGPKTSLKKSGGGTTSNAQTGGSRGPTSGSVSGKKIAGNTPKGGREMRAGAYPKPGRGTGKATGQGKVGKGFVPGSTKF